MGGCRRRQRAPSRSESAAPRHPSKRRPLGRGRGRGRSRQEGPAAQHGAGEAGWTGGSGGCCSETRAAAVRPRRLRASPAAPSIGWSVQSPCTAQRGAGGALSLPFGGEPGAASLPAQRSVGRGVRRAVGAPLAASRAGSKPPRFRVPARPPPTVAAKARLARHSPSSPARRARPSESDPGPDPWPSARIVQHGRIGAALMTRRKWRPSLELLPAAGPPPARRRPGPTPVRESTPSGRARPLRVERQSSRFQTGSPARPGR